MKCPECGNIEDKVIETRESRDNHYIRRRRECLKCGKRFTTYEKPEDTHLMVVKKDGRREEFDIDKVKKGLYRAVEKRPKHIPEVNFSNHLKTYSAHAYRNCGECTRRKRRNCIKSNPP